MTRVTGVREVVTVHQACRPKLIVVFPRHSFLIFVSSNHKFIFIRYTNYSGNTASTNDYERTNEWDRKRQ